MADAAHGDDNAGARLGCTGDRNPGGVFGCIDHAVAADGGSDKGDAGFGIHRKAATGGGGIAVGVNGIDRHSLFIFASRQIGGGYGERPGRARDHSSIGLCADDHGNGRSGLGCTGQNRATRSLGRVDRAIAADGILVKGHAGLGIDNQHIVDCDRLFTLGDGHLDRDLVRAGVNLGGLKRDRPGAIGPDHRGFGGHADHDRDRGPDCAGAGDIDAIGVILGIDHMTHVLGPGQDGDGGADRACRTGISFRTAQHHGAKTCTDQRPERAQTHQERGGQHADLIIGGADHRRFDPVGHIGEIQFILGRPFAEHILFDISGVIGAFSAWGQGNPGQHSIGRDEQIVLHCPIGTEIALDHDHLTIVQGDQQRLPVAGKRRDLRPFKVKRDIVASGHNQRVIRTCPANRTTFDIARTIADNEINR